MLRQRYDSGMTDAARAVYSIRWQDRALYIAALCLAILTACLAFAVLVEAAAAQMEPPTLEGKAKAATLYALPLVIMDATRQLSLLKPGTKMNQFSHQATLADASARMVIRPNVDTLYSNAWLDLSSGPVFLRVPPSNGRFFLIQCMDAWTNVFADPGIRTLGNREVTFAIVGPRWQGSAPEKTVLLRSPTEVVWVLARIYVRSDADLSAARSFQESLNLRPMAVTTELSKSTPKKEPAASNVRRTGRPSMLKILQRAGPERFFNRYLNLSAHEPPVPTDARFMAEVLNPLGLTGNRSTWQDLPPNVREVLTAAYQNVLGSLADRSSVESKDRQIGNGWTTLMGPSHGIYGSDYELRAAVAAFGLGAKVKEDGTTFNAAFDAHGEKLDGDKRYRVTFEKGATPPVQAFWSITLYDDEGYLVNNASRRYAVTSGRDLAYGPDGSLTVLIQPDDPGPTNRTNWIPTPKGTSFELALRCYWPRDPILKDKWIPPAIVPLN